jgi:hypothetical protein
MRTASWLLDSAKTTDKGGGSARGAGTQAGGLGHQANQLARIIEISPAATIDESQHNDFVVDLKNNVIVIADEAIGEVQRCGQQGALVVVDLGTGTSRRCWGHASVMPDRARSLGSRLATAGSFNLYVGVDGIALDKDSEWLYSPLSA